MAVKCAKREYVRDPLEHRGIRDRPQDLRDRVDPQTARLNVVRLTIAVDQRCATALEFVKEHHRALDHRDQLVPEEMVESWWWTWWS